MRVVLVDPRADSRPYDHGLAEGLVGLGHTVELVSCRFRHYALEAPPGVRLREPFYRLADRLPGPARRLARGAEHPVDVVALAARLRRDPPDVVHVQWLPLRTDAALWRLLDGVVRVPRVLTLHNPSRGGDARAAARAVRRFHRTVVHGERARAALVAAGAPANRIEVVPHGALAAYARMPATPSRIGPGPPVALMAGRLRPYKGLGLLLDAWPAVRAAVPDAVLHVAGRPVGEPDAARAAGMAADGVVLDARYQAEPELAGALRRADVVVLPYRRIDQSGVLLAALALGRPVVATDVGGVGEVVADTGAGLLVPPGDAPALAAAVARVLGDGALRARLADAAAAAAAGPYAWDAVAGRTAALYRSLGAGADGP